MSFSTVPLRGYGVVSPDWWNALRTAGIALESSTGTAVPFIFANNQVSAANITGCVIDKTTCKISKITIAARRNTSTTDAYALIELTAVYREFAAAWDIVQNMAGPDDPGLVFSIDSVTGQVKYTSTNLSGTGYNGASVFLMQNFSII